MSLYPLKFQPRFVDKIWGGRKIESVLGKTLPAGKMIGESWELFDFPPGVVGGSRDWISAAVASGPLAGKTLHQLVGEFGRELCGSAPLVAPHGQFPILIKFLDARENLSVQVHPDQAYCDGHPGAFLKSEAWYVMDSDPGAKLYRGIKPGVSRDGFQSGIEEGTVEDLIKAIPVRSGDCFYLPSGTVHALGAGILVAEVQTPSDTTFRVFDFNRKDPATGKPRSLHVCQAMECIHFDGPSEPAQVRSHVATVSTTVTRLVTCPYFTMEKVRVSAGVERPLVCGEPVVWIMLEGKASVTVGGLDEPVEIVPGETVLFPAAMDKPMLKTLTDCVWLETTFPAKAAAL